MRRGGVADVCDGDERPRRRAQVLTQALLSRNEVTLPSESYYRIHFYFRRDQVTRVTFLYPERPPQDLLDANREALDECEDPLLLDLKSLTKVRGLYWTPIGPKGGQ